jgi:hypothetical protein
MLDRIRLEQLELELFYGEGGQHVERFRIMRERDSKVLQELEKELYGEIQVGTEETEEIQGRGKSGEAENTATEETFEKGSVLETEDHRSGKGNKMEEQSFNNGERTTIPREEIDMEEIGVKIGERIRILREENHSAAMGSKGKREASGEENHYGGENGIIEGRVCRVDISLLFWFRRLKRARKRGFRETDMAIGGGFTGGFYLLVHFLLYLLVHFLLYLVEHFLVEIYGGSRNIPGGDFNVFVGDINWWRYYFLLELLMKLNYQRFGLVPWSRFALCC